MEDQYTNINRTRFVITDGSNGRVTDMLRLVEGLWYVAGEYGVNRADDDEHDGVAESDHVGGVDVGGADEQVVLPGGVVVDGSRRRHQHPHHVYEHL